jgi:putative FmdB family regulatory protein
MPIYEYKCKSCGKTFEVLTNQNDRERGCIFCNGKAEKIVTKSNFVIS